MWTRAELDTVLGGEAPLATEYWGVTTEGNFEGKNILHVPNDHAVVAARHGISAAELRARLASAKHALLAARGERVRPGRDDKILASWNGLMVRALAEAARALDRMTYRAEAIRHGEFLFRALVREGRVLRSYKDGVAKIGGYLEDYAALGLAALALYELTFDDVWLTRARTLVDAAVEWFWDDGAGAFFDTPHDHEVLVTRPRDVTDNATPSGTSLVAELLARLADLLQDETMRRRATYVLETVAEPMARHPAAFGHALGVADLLVRGAVELAIVGDPASEDFRALTRAAAERYVPSLVLAGGAARSAPADRTDSRHSDRSADGGRPRDGIRLPELRLRRAGHRRRPSGNAARCGNDRLTTSGDAAGDLGAHHFQHGARFGESVAQGGDHRRQHIGRGAVTTPPLDLGRALT